MLVICNNAPNEIFVKHSYSQINRILLEEKTLDKVTWHFELNKQ